MRTRSDSAAPEQAFADFRRTGDTRALAAAFDATAPELLRVAAFLVARDDVEDLVHETFGIALQRRADFDATRPLLPWLLGILANEARAVRRRVRMRDRERAAPAPAAERDPAAVAGDRETAAAFDGALQQLARDEADLLRWHLIDDLSCREIADRMHRPAGTVRTQVARAMGELRRRLPVGLAIAPGFGAADATVLANVRTRVLARAPAIVAVGGMWLRPRAWFAALFAAAAVAVAAVVLLRQTEVPAAVSAVTVAVVDAPQQRGDIAPPDASGDRPLAPTAERAQLTAVKPQWSLHGKVLTESGDPIVGAQVACHLVEMGPELVRTSTDADGRYQLDLGWWRDRPQLDRVGYGLVVVAQAAGHNDCTWFESMPVAVDVGQPFLLEHDFVLQDYVTVAGRVVDAERRPVAAEVTAWGTTPDAPLHDVTKADADGRFRLVFADRVREVVVKAVAAAAGRAEVRIEAPTGGERDLGELVLERGLDLRGRVLLTDGTPVPDCEVFLRGGLTIEDGLPQVGPEYWYCSTRTDGDGRWLASRPHRTDWSVTAQCGVGFGEANGFPEHRQESSADAADVVVDGVRVDFDWRDASGNELLPHATRVVVFAADAADAAVAARSGDAAALQRALADKWTRDAHLVAPCGAYLWLQSRAQANFGVDRLVQLPSRNGSFAVELRYAEAASTQLTLRVRFADGAVPEQFTCKVEPQPGASLFGYEEIARAVGEVRGRCAVGPIAVELAAYADSFDDVTERRTLVAAAARDNVVDVVLARRGRIRFVLRDVAAPDRVTDDGLDGDVTIGGVRARRFFWQRDEMEYWGSPPLGHPVESMAMVPIGRQEVTFEFEGYRPTAVVFDVTEAAAEVVPVWLQPQ